MLPKENTFMIGLYWVTSMSLSNLMLYKRDWISRQNKHILKQTTYSSNKDTCRKIRWAMAKSFLSPFPQIQSTRHIPSSLAENRWQPSLQPPLLPSVDPTDPSLLIFHSTYFTSSQFITLSGTLVNQETLLPGQ